jgi:hypothetical protein
MDEDGFDWHHADHQQWYMHEWDGDHLLSPFQCDMWWLRNIQPRNPLLYMGKDTLLLCCIHRADLAAMWGGDHLWYTPSMEKSHIWADNRRSWAWLQCCHYWVPSWSKIHWNFSCSWDANEIAGAWETSEPLLDTIHCTFILLGTGKISVM